MEEDSITRPIYWNIPESYQTIMYFLFFAALAVLLLA